MNITLLAAATLLIAISSAIGGPDLTPHLVSGGGMRQSVGTVASGAPGRGVDVAPSRLGAVGRAGA